LLIQLRKPIFRILAALLAAFLLLPSCIPLREAEPRAPETDPEVPSPEKERPEITAAALLAANQSELLIERYGTATQTETWSLFTRTTQRRTVNGYNVLYTEENHHHSGEEPYSGWVLHLSAADTDIEVSDVKADAPQGFIDYDHQNALEIPFRNDWEDSSPFLRMILSDPEAFRIETDDDAVVCRFDGKVGLYDPGHFLADPESLLLTSLGGEHENAEPVEEGKTVFTYGDPPLAESLLSALEQTRRVVYHIERNGETSDLALDWPAGWYLTVHFKSGCQLFADEARTEPIHPIMAVPADGSNHEIWVTDNPS